MTKKENRIRAVLAVFVCLILLFAWPMQAAAVQGTEDEVEEEQGETETEGEDIPEEEPDYGNETGAVIFHIGKHGTAKINGTAYTSADSGLSVQYDAGTTVTAEITADSGYSIDEIYVLDEQGSYQEYVVGFDSDSKHHMTFSVYGGMTQDFYVDFAVAEQDEFAGVAGTVKFRTTTDTSLSRIDGGHVYRSENGDIAYCGDASKHAPDTTGLSMKLDKNNANQSAYDYIMYYGYPKHTTILGTKYSKKDAHDITQWAIWLIMNPSYNRGTFRANPTLSAVSAKLAASARKYDGSNAKINGSAFVYYPSSSKRQPMVIANLDKAYGKLKLSKSTSNQALTEGNGCYSLTGAGYAVYSDEACANRVAILTTKSDGSTDTVELSTGVYYVKEVSASSGYAINPEVKKITIKDNTTTTLKVKETPQAGYPNILLEKVDAETGKQKAQGSASLAGAEFTVKYYDGLYSEKEAALHTPKRTWKFQTDKNGQVKWTDDPNYFLGGDALYYDADGKPVIPLGTVLITETKEPEGYMVDTSVKRIEITSNGSGGTASVKNYAIGTGAFKEQIRRADIQIMKYGEHKDDNYSGVRTALQGVVFTITSNTTGESWTIATDEDGIATTKSLNISDRGNLVYDTYTVEETVNPYSEYDKMDPFEVVLEPSLQEDGKIYYFGIVNMEIFTPIQVVKTDASTGKTIPLSNTEFQILDEDKNVMELTISQYPKKTTATSFVTDESGAFTFPELFDYGTYYLREVQAPEGYICSQEPLKITVDELHGWEEPMVITFPDENVMGQIELTKVEAETEKALAGAEFTVRAAEDIVTPDGTLRCAKDEIADVFTTDENGYGCSGKLFLGKYTVEETGRPQGYILDQTVYGVELTYEDQNTPLVKENLGMIFNKPVTVIINKLQAGTDIALEGVGFQIWNASSEEAPGAEDELDDMTEFVDAGMTLRETYNTDENGQIVLQYLNPGTYKVQETSPLPGYIPDDTVYTFTVDENGRTEGMEAYELTIENEPTQMRTTASNAEDHTKTVSPNATSVICDTVTLNGLIVGKEYRICGWQMNQTENEKLLLNGQEVTGETVFTADSESMEVNVLFYVDTSALGGAKLVTFEELYDVSDSENPILVTEHKDIQDEGQTVEVEEIPEESEQPEEPQQPEKEEKLTEKDKNEEPESIAVVTKKTPKTGDDTHIWPWIAAIISGAVVIGRISRRQHRKRKKKR